MDAWKPRFGTSGVRGVVETELTPQVAWRLGLAVANAFHSQPLLLCHDSRTSGPLLAQAVASGLMAGGSQVLYGGMTITPAASFYVRRRGISGGVIVTGSHIPVQMSGVEVLASDGSPVSRSTEQRIERFISSPPPPIPWSRQGSIKKIDDVGTLWVEGILQQVDLELLRQRNFRVVVDACNGSAIPWLLKAVAELGCTVVAVNARRDPCFPGRSPNLTASLLEGTARIVRETGSDLGVAVDGDGDRVLFIDDKGRPLMGDVSGSILASIELERRGGGIIVAPINTSNLIEEVASRYGGKVVYSRVGPPAIVAQMKRHHAIFGFEESGKIIYPHLNYLSDSGMATAHLLQYLAQRNLKLSVLVDELPKYHQLKRAINCPNRLKPRVLNHVLQRAKESGLGELLTIDGVKIVLDDGWLLLRPSGTEPIFRIFTEAKTKQKAQQLLQQGMKWVDEVLGHKATSE